MLPFPTIVIEKTVLTVLLGVALVLFAVMTIIFRYHWNRYGFSEPVVAKMRKLYGLVSALLLGLALIFYLLSVFAL